MIENITGIILAGGKSKRIGTNKAFLKIGEKTIIEQILTKFKAIFREIVVVAEDTTQYNALQIRVVKDMIPSKGPLGGIYTGLVSSSNIYNFITACDMPFLNLELIKFMFKQIEDFDIIIPVHEGKLEPLYAIYSKRCIKPIEKELSSNNLKITDFFCHVKIRTIDEREIARFDPTFKIFTNINTWRDYENLTCKVEP